jgi:thiamine biosynthesis lipoprotein
MTDEDTRTGRGISPLGDETWLRRARPVLGTLVEIGLPPEHAKVLPDLWAVLDLVQARMSMHEEASDLGLLHAAPPRHPVTVHVWTAAVLHLAQAWHRACPAFDVAQGSGAWRIQGVSAQRLSAGTRLDLGGLAKGWAVDRVVQAATDLGVPAIWVNAGGDLRVRGTSLPIVLRDELQGGVHPWGELSDGALATSDFRSGARAHLWRDADPSAPRDAQPGCHLSVMAPTCATADALTKVVALWGLSDPRTDVLLQAHHAKAWVHDRACDLMP